MKGMKALLFDVYGTLLDTRGCSMMMLKDIIHQSGRKMNPQTVYKEWRKEIESQILNMNTTAKFKPERVFFPKALHRAFRKLRIKDSGNRRMILYKQVCWGNRGVFDETRGVLKQLSRRYTIATASNSDTKPLLADFRNHHITLQAITSEMLKIYKPHKAFFEGALKKLNLSPDETIYIGDTYRSDIEGASKAGIKTIWLNRKRQPMPRSRYHPLFTITTLKHLPRLI